MRVTVVGGGIAGTAAAWAARRAKADVTVVFDRAGASSLYSGALDFEQWDAAPGAASDERDIQLFATALEAWTFRPGPSRLATFDGVVRTARAHDTALLDLSPLAGRTISVAETPSFHFDARSVARSLAASAWARDTRTRFEAVPVADLVPDSYRAAPSYDVALRADDDAGPSRIALALTTAHPEAEAWLLGPWLGTRPGSADRVRALLSVPCGEVTSPPGGPAGSRFEASRDALFTTSGIRTVHGRISRISRDAQGYRVEGDGLTSEVPPADLAVLAVGGVCAEGLVLGSSTFRLAFEAPVTITLDGRVLDGTSPLAGAVARVSDPGALVRLGILADGPLARGGNGLLVAGDCVAGRPRTALEAVRAGIVTMRTIRVSLAPSPRP